MRTYETFIFECYVFNAPAKTLELHYGYDDTLHFTEKYSFDFDFADHDPLVLDRALQNLFFIAGVSYYKAFLAPRIVVRQGSIDTKQAAFLARTYQQGLGEFFYVNHLDPTEPITFPINAETATTLSHDATGLLIGLGGGKDSLVTTEALSHEPRVATWSVGHRAQLTPLVQRIGLPHLWVERQWDRQLLALNQAGAYNGHVPISAILAAAGAVAAVLGGYKEVVVSNEQSANEPTLTYRGVAINHQYSKSQAFETAWQELLTSQFGNTLHYYSFLRPLSELSIAEMFAKQAFEKYNGLFSSCNRAYRANSSELSWCGECSKCAFVYLALANFIDAVSLTTIFNGKNLLLEDSLEPTFRQLLGIEGDKPLECVGAIQESRYAMRQLQTTYPELQKYQFELQPDYDYRTMGTHSMPATMIAKLAAIAPAI